MYHQLVYLLDEALSIGSAVCYLTLLLASLPIFLSRVALEASAESNYPCGVASTPRELGSKPMVPALLGG